MLCTLSRTISLYIHIVYCKDRQEVHKHYTCYLNIVGIKYIYRATSMHMKVSQLSSDMYTAQYMLMHGIRVCMHTVYTVLGYAIKNGLYRRHEWWVKGYEK